MPKSYDNVVKSHLQNTEYFWNKLTKACDPINLEQSRSRRFEKCQITDTILRITVIGLRFEYRTRLPKSSNEQPLRRPLCKFVFFFNLGQLFTMFLGLSLECLLKLCSIVALKQYRRWWRQRPKWIWNTKRFVFSFTQNQWSKPIDYTSASIISRAHASFFPIHSQLAFVPAS